jgi:hypothetical protein
MQAAGSNRDYRHPVQRNGTDKPGEKTYPQISQISTDVVGVTWQAPNL